MLQIYYKLCRCFNGGTTKTTTKDHYMKSLKKQLDDALDRAGFNSVELTLGRAITFRYHLGDHDNVATGTITGTWVNPPTGSSTSPGTKMQLSTDGGTTWVDSCTGTGTATTCKSTAVPLGVIYRVRFIRLALDPQFNSDPSPVSIVSAIKEPGPSGTTAIITIN